MIHEFIASIYLLQINTIQYHMNYLWFNWELGVPRWDRVEFDTVSRTLRWRQSSIWLWHPEGIFLVKLHWRSDRGRTSQCEDEGFWRCCAGAMPGQVSCWTCLYLFVVLIILEWSEPEAVREAIMTCVINSLSIFQCHGLERTSFWAAF